MLSISADQLQDIFSDVPQFSVRKSDMNNGIPVVDFLAEFTDVLPSKGEARRMLKSNAVSLNKEKVSDDKIITNADLINDTYIIVQRGKKNYYLISISD